MKKRLLIIILMTAIISGCSSSNSSSSNNGVTSIDEYRERILDAGYTIEQENEKTASLIGAVEGIGFITDVGNVEIYLFAKNSKVYSEAKKTKKLNGFDVICENNLCIGGIIPVPQELIDLFTK